jgi:putative oxidoreductase
MKIVKPIPAYLLGLIYFVFGLNFWLKFIPMPPMSGDPATYFGVMYTSGYLTIVKVLEVGIAVLLFVPKTRALAYLLIAPITINILLYEILIAKQPGIAVGMLLINAIGIYFNKEKYLSIIK